MICSPNNKEYHIEYEKKGNTKITTIFEPEYPPILTETYKPPWVLYAKGNPSLLTMDRLLAVVGSRKQPHLVKNRLKYYFPSLLQEESSL